MSCFLRTTQSFCRAASPSVFAVHFFTRLYPSTAARSFCLRGGCAGSALDAYSHLLKVGLSYTSASHTTAVSKPSLSPNEPHGQAAVLTTKNDLDSQPPSRQRSQFSSISRLLFLFNRRCRLLTQRNLFPLASSPARQVPLPMRRQSVGPEALDDFLLFFRRSFVSVGRSGQDVAK